MLKHRNARLLSIPNCAVNDVPLFEQGCPPDPSRLDESASHAPSFFYTHLEDRLVMFSKRALPVWVIRQVDPIQFVTSERREVPLPPGPYKKRRWKSALRIQMLPSVAHLTEENVESPRGHFVVGPCFR